MNHHTEGSGGFYYNAEGRIEDWGSNAAAFIARTSTSLQDGKFTIGQMANHFAAITEPTTVTLPLIFQYGVNVYVVNVAYTVVPAATPDEPIVYELVARDAIYKQMVPSADTYAYSTTTTLDLEYIEGLISSSSQTRLRLVKKVKNLRWNGHLNTHVVLTQDSGMALQLMRIRKVKW